MPQTAVSIRDPASNVVLRLGVIGEICVRGYCNMIGYHANPAATAETIDAEGLPDARGYLRITGRLIIRGGENLFPAEIENTLLEHGDVAEVAVIGLPDPRWGEVVAAFVRPDSGCTVDLWRSKLFAGTVCRRKKPRPNGSRSAPFPDRLGQNSEIRFA